MNFDEAQRLAAVAHKRKQGGDVMGTLTLRDYFAAKALQGLLSNRNAEAAIDEFAVKSYRMADAMLKAREQK